MLFSSRNNRDLKPPRASYDGAADGANSEPLSTAGRAEAIRDALSIALGMDQRIVVLVAPVDSIPPSLDLLHPAEWAAVQRAVEKRVHEFVVGRVLARHAAHLLGLAELVLPMGWDRAPVWPAGIVGSITHTSQWCAVAIGRTHEVAGLGLDIEDHSRVSEALATRIMTRCEFESYSRLDPRKQELMRSLVFSAKEAAFKGQYGLTKTMLNFQDVDTHIDIDRLAFHPAYHPPEVARILRPFAQSCRQFHMNDIVGSAVKVTAKKT